MIKAKINIAPIKKTFEVLISKGQNLRPALNAIEGTIMDSMADTFEKEGVPKWENLSKRRQAERVRKGRGANSPKLRDDSILINSIVPKIEGNKVRIGTNNKYAATHQYGDKKRNIPARPFLVYRKKDDEEIREILGRHFGTTKT